ncbi:MAG TPA: DUF5320 family protein [Bacteroidales bacterium]|nr:DUF5320 family protein [Bacteroidales bacterium]HPS26736.1 DUF5320 family protein [Bacteroidales bacterium]HQI69947.1 DUF5320 family protein [Bacteroidales bacterium]
MPNKDGTGPAGKGSGTGRRQGKSGSKNTENNDAKPRGVGRCGQARGGKGQGMGKGKQ